MGILGHSEGGAIAFMLAAEGLPDFIVSLAGPAVRGDSLLLAQNKALLGALGSLMTIENHLFQHCQSGHPNEYATIEETIAEEVLQDITRWILSF